MWDVEATGTFDAWFELQNRALKKNMLTMMLVLSEFGLQFRRPYVNTVRGSTFQNMKELRVQHHGPPTRAFFAFNPLRRIIVLCAGNKDGINEKRFYKEMITSADKEFNQHLTKER